MKKQETRNTQPCISTRRRKLVFAKINDEFRPVIIKINKLDGVVSIIKVF